ncbi:MAG: hypothetical protein AAFQ45_05610 [Pseudomonadota bacterium]
MSTFLISYDLANPSSNKHVLANAIMASGSAWARPLSQTWYVKSEQDADFLEAFISATLDDEDELVVQEIGEEAAKANTALRWFRHRAKSSPGPTSEDQAGANVVAFPPTERQVHDLTIELSKCA